MADQDFVPLTEAERAELEALRAEKARRERAELEELRAEQAASVAPAPPETGSDDVEPARPISAEPVGTDTGSEPAAAPAPVAAPDAPAPKKPSEPKPAEPAGAARAAEPAERTFGQRMVLSEGEDADGLPSMPPAQKIIIGVCLVCAIGAALFVALSNAGIIG